MGNAAGKITIQEGQTVIEYAGSYVILFISRLCQSTAVFPLLDFDEHFYYLLYFQRFKTFSACLFLFPSFLYNGIWSTNTPPTSTPAQY